MPRSSTNDRPLTRREADELLAQIQRLLGSHGSPSRFLTVEEVTDRLRISRAALYNLFTRGALRRHNIGRSVRVLESDLEAYIAGRESRT